MKVTQTVKLDSHGLALTLVPRRNCLRVVMRITPEGARFSVPYGIDFESLEPIVRKMLTEHADKLRPAPLYTRGQIIETSFGSIAITSGTGGRGLRLRETNEGFEVGVSPALDIASRPVILAIANGLKQIGTLIVRRHILDEAREFADSLTAGRWDTAAAHSAHAAAAEPPLKSASHIPWHSCRQTCAATSCATSWPICGK